MLYSQARCNKANDGILCGDNGAAMENFIVHEVVKQGDPSNKEVGLQSTLYNNEITLT